MLFRWLFLLALLSSGCRTVWHGPSSVAGAPVADPLPGENFSCPASSVGAAGNCGSGMCAPAPCQPENRACQEIHVTAPRQRVHVPAPVAPEAAAPQVVEQQVAQTRQVILVPQQVYVPFVQATNFGAVRVNGLQQTQFLNAQGVLTSAAASGIATVQGVTAAAGGASGFGSQAAGGVETISQEDARKYKDELTKARADLIELTGIVQNLQAQVQALSNRVPR
jgi:hypothetical protein